VDSQRAEPILARREVLKDWLLSAVGMATGLACFPMSDAGFERSDGSLLQTIEFLNEGNVVLDAPTGEELDGRLYSDLSRLDLERPITPPDKFYIRTRASSLLPRSNLWHIKIDGLVDREMAIDVAQLRTQSRAMGPHLMECSGNNRATRFGLLSVANWTGIPLATIIEKSHPAGRASRVVVSGFDEYRSPSVNSIPGASWNFALDEIASSKAFLATDMAGRPLTKDHGAPIRLVVPGWYGCACIKWVQTITLADQETESTSQMREFASRTGQNGVPDLARDFSPAIIQLGAMPIRIEKRRANEKIHYRVVGLCWGGSRPATSLFIRFNPEEDYVPVQHFRPATDGLWTAWTHDWFPARPGKFLIRLMTKDVGLTQRINSGYFVREVEIEDV